MKRSSTHILLCVFVFIISCRKDVADPLRPVRLHGMTTSEFGILPGCRFEVLRNGLHFGYFHSDAQGGYDTTMMDDIFTLNNYYILYDTSDTLVSYYDSAFVDCSQLRNEKKDRTFEFYQDVNVMYQTVVHYHIKNTHPFNSNDNLSFFKMIDSYNSITVAQNLHGANVDTTITLLQPRFNLVYKYSWTRNSIDSTNTSYWQIRPSSIDTTLDLFY